jgi:ankyrin repeat protein
MSTSHEGARKRLPAKPSVENLKKQAKALAKDQPSLSLQQAQHQLAKSYGYTNWDELLAEATATRESPLHPETIKAFVGAFGGDIQIVRKMLDVEPRLVKSELDGYSMLSYAAENGSARVIQLLMERGANPNAYWTGTLHSPLSWAVTCDRPEAYRSLVKGGAKVDLFCAAGMGILDCVKNFFDEHGAVKPGASITGSSRQKADGAAISALSSEPVEIISDALYIACRTGKVDVGIYLLERGANPGFPAYMGATCFHWAYFGGGAPRLVQAMLAHGGDPKSIYAERRCTPRGFGILVASGWGWAYYMNRILDVDASLANLSEGGSTPLHEAARNGHVQAVKILLARGADSASVDAEGVTALKRALEGDHDAVARLLQL